jgi:(4-O-methyl)-D-glucuronate---lignin esterase
MDGNVTREGIQRDLEWMRRVGVGGVILKDIGLTTPQRVDTPVRYMTPAWQEAARFAAHVAARLGLGISVASSPGWSGAGGPWIRPQEAMKKLVWSETRIEGGRPFTGRLPAPPATIGPYQDVPIDRRNLISGAAPARAIQEVYGDVAVIAYRIPETEVSLGELDPVVTSSAGPIEGPRLWDGDLHSTVSIPFAPQGQSAWIQFAFHHAVTIDALSLVLPNSRYIAGFFSTPTVMATLCSSEDANRWTKVTDILSSSDVEQTLAFAPVTSRYFRLSLPTPAPIRIPTEIASSLGVEVHNPTEHLLAEALLHTAARVHRGEDKAAFFVASDLDDAPTPPAAAATVVDKDQIIDLTSRMHPDGSLDWTPPNGRWAVVRFGYSLLGITTHPTSAEATGLQIDALSRTAALSYSSHYLDLLSKALPGLRALDSDSWELGAQNFTVELPAEFARRRGYALEPWLPALTGRVIGSAEQTDRFLWDYRRTLGEMLAENRYGAITEELHRRHMLHSAESHEFGRALIGDGMDIKRAADIPVGAMWTDELRPQRAYDADLRESASVAHLYGRNLVGAESLTTHALRAYNNAFAYGPETLKPVIDRELSDGVNYIILHSSPHQPDEAPGPGLTLGPYGQWFTRHETWADQAGPWLRYISRSAFLLQQGHFAADVLYFYGQDSNITALFGQRLPPVPQGYAFDFASADALRQLSVSDGKLVTDSGMSYRVLALDPRTRRMSLDVLQQIAHLVQQGATIVGGKPRETPSLADDMAGFQALASAVWGSGDAGVHAYGSGQVIVDRSLPQVLESLGVQPDFSYSGGPPDTTVWFVHRRLSQGSVYFIDNRLDKAVTIDASFRLEDKAPELWHADSGEIQPVAYRMENGRTIVPLTLPPYDAVFVVFRRASSRSREVFPQVQTEVLARLQGPWDIRFPPHLGAPPQIRLEELRSWTDCPEAGVKYFSGTATYEKTVAISRQWLRDRSRVVLDLGQVRNLAEVLVNGRSAGILWKAPFRIDISKELQAGDNRLQIRITNLWPNRLIGDRQPGAHPVAFASYDPFTADSALLPSGLLGPVRILRTTAE